MELKLSFTLKFNMLGSKKKKLFIFGPYVQFLLPLLLIGVAIYVGDFQNNGITLEPKVVTLHGNHSYTLEHYYLLLIMNHDIDSSIYGYNLWQNGA